MTAPASVSVPPGASPPDRTRASASPPWGWTQLRPLALPTEHGGWGFLLEPLALGLAVAPSRAGALLVVAALAAFLARQPLKLAMQDALRLRSYPRTRWCRLFAAAYLTAASAAGVAAVALSGWRIAVPFLLAAPLVAVALSFDARNRSRAAVAEYCGAIGMSSTAAAVLLAAGNPWTAALAATLLVLARSVPSILYVRTLLQRAHKRAASGWPAAAVHLLAVPAAYAVSGSWSAAAATALLSTRCAWGLSHEVPAATTIGWREITWGAVSVTLFAIALR